LRRADRLFQIVQLLRGGRVVTAGYLAQELEVSERTIYRDIADLTASGVPIEGEAGVGYQLPRGFDLPPLMFTEDEIEALVLGARMVESWGDPALARQGAQRVVEGRDRAAAAAREAPARRRALRAGILRRSASRPATSDRCGKAIAEQRKVSFGYVNLASQASQRTVRPLGLYFWGSSWTLVGWCEMRADFRNFRPDRMRELTVLDERFPTNQAATSPPSSAA
jgi:predicted DNA-binding transcriptional regulator YafY